MRLGYDIVDFTKCLHASISKTLLLPESKCNCFDVNRNNNETGVKSGAFISCYHTSIYSFPCFNGLVIETLVTLFVT